MVKRSLSSEATLTLSELRIELKQKRAEAAGLRIGLLTQKDKDSARYKRVRREIAGSALRLVRQKKASLSHHPGRRQVNAETKMRRKR